MKKGFPLDDFETEGIVSVPYPAHIRSLVEKAIGSWKRFCALDERIRVQFPYDAGAGMGVGYELKKSPGATLDLKEDFHFAKPYREWLLGAAAAMGDKDVSSFVADAHELMDALRPFILDFARLAEERFSLRGFAQEIAESDDAWFLRFLHYFRDRDVGDIMAAPHADKDGFTTHLYEDASGFEYLDYAKQWKPVSFVPGQTMVIPGMRLQYRSRNRLRATYHRVRATPETATAGRFSAVCFVHPKNTPAYDKARAGRLQEFEPGFNYDMPFDEFRKLFLA